MESTTRPPPPPVHCRGAERVGGLEGGLEVSRASRVRAAACGRQRQCRWSSCRRPAGFLEAAPTGGGVVRQHGFGSYVPFEDAGVAVQKLASQVVTQLARAATPGTPILPPFNEATWTHYPAGLGHISEHRDPPAYTGIIVVTTLLGEARFVACSDGGDQQEWLTSTGDIVLLTGWGWPTDRSRCPVHAVDPPAATDRMILTLRSNARGAGADYL